MKFDNFSAVDSGFSNFVITNAQNPFIYDNVLSIDILPWPSVNFINTTYGVGLTPNRKLILQTRRLGAYSGVNEAQVIFPKLIQARHRFFQLFIADTAAHTSAYWNQTMVMYDNYLAQINSTIIPLGYRIDKSINNNLVLDKIRRTLPCGNDEVSLDIPNYYASKYSCMLTTPKLNVSGACVIYRLLVRNGTSISAINNTINLPAPRFRAFIQTLSNRDLANVECGSYPRGLSQTTIQQNPLLNTWNIELQINNYHVGLSNCLIQMVSGRFPLTMLPQITNT